MASNRKAGAKGNGTAPASRERNHADLRQAILAADDQVLRRVQCPEWGVPVYVRTLSVGERAAMEAALAALEAGENGTGGSDAGWIATAVQHMACDHEGTPIFGPEDIPALQQRNHQVLWRVFNAGARLNALRVEDQEETQGNSDGIPDSASTFG